MVAGFGHQRRNAVGREDAAGGGGVERANDPRERRRVGGAPRKGVIAVDPHADSIGGDGVGQDVRQPVGILEQCLVRRHRAQQLVGDVARAPLIFDHFLALAHFDPHR